MLAREVRLLFRKELRQLLRNKGALLTAFFLPVLLMLVFPMGQLLSANPHRPRDFRLPPELPLPPGLAELSKDPLAAIRLLLTPILSMGGLITPALTSSYAFTSERESRTLELLVALPVRVEQILQAKLLAVLAVTTPVCLALYGVDAWLLLTRGMGSPGYVAALFVMVVGSLAFSSSTALFVSLLARDIRTSSNLNGLVLTPFILGSFAIMALVPGTTLASLVLAGSFAVGTVGVLLLALRVVTYERMLR